MRLTAASPPRLATTSSRLTFMGASIGNLLACSENRSGGYCLQPQRGRTMAYGLWRALVVLHRYLGIAVGLLMALWFVSGIVMMYVGFPRLTEAERLRAVSPVPWQACCRFGDLLADDQPILRAQVENHLGEP